MCSCVVKTQSTEVGFCCLIPVLRKQDNKHLQDNHSCCVFQLPIKLQPRTQTAFKYIVIGCSEGKNIQIKPFIVNKRLLFFHSSFNLMEKRDLKHKLTLSTYTKGFL